MPGPLHVPAEWQLSGDGQDFGVPLHTPLIQASPVVHASPSSQVPVCGGFEQMPELHAAPWHWSPAAHVMHVAPPLPQLAMLWTPYK
jgi:hypothetical protein